jgi:CheY-like chemotaxis protein
MDLLFEKRGAEVLSALKTSEPDLLVLDIMMPNVHGLELLRQLRKQSFIPVSSFLQGMKN